MKRFVFTCYRAAAWILLLVGIAPVVIRLLNGQFTITPDNVQSFATGLWVLDLLSYVKDEKEAGHA